MADVGKLGEKHLDTLCTRASLHINKAYEDETGWDFLVEFRDTILDTPASATELSHGAKQCKIQVKSSFGNLDYSTLYLTNLHRLATDPLPAFIFLTEFDERGRPLRSNLIHIDEGLITKILQRVRELDTTDPGRKLNERTMRVRAESHSYIPPDDELAFLAALQHHIKPTLAHYVARKIQHLSTTGFEVARENITFDINQLVEGPSIVDASIGLVPGVAVNNFVVRPSRFEITDTEPSIHEPEGWLEFPNLTPENVQMVFKSTPLAPETVFSAQLYISPFNEHLPEQVRKVRIKGSFFEHIFNPSVPGSYPLKINFNSPMQLSELASAIRFISAIDENSSQSHVFLRRGGRDLRLCQLGNEFDGNLPSEVVSSVNTAESIVLAFGQYPTSNVFLDDLANDYPHLSALDEILNQPDMTIKAVLETTVDQELDTRDFAAVGMIPAPIGEKLYIAVILVIGPGIKQDDGRISVSSNNVILLRKLVIDRANVDLEAIKAEMTEAAAAYEESYNVFLLNVGAD